MRLLLLRLRYRSGESEKEEEELRVMSPTSWLLERSRFVTCGSSNMDEENSPEMFFC